MKSAELIIFSVQIYAAIGGVVAALFLLWGIDRIDASARHAYTFRPLLLPGVLVLWPLVLWRWRRLEAEHKQ